ALLAQTKVLQDQLKFKHVIDTHTECQAQYTKLEEDRYEYMIRYSDLCDNDKHHRKKIDKQEILFDKMIRQLVEINNNVLRLQEKILEKETKISELERCTIHMIMPSKDTLNNGRKGIGFENPSYFEKAKDMRPSLYDEKVIGLGYTPMILIHSNEALKIKKFNRARENKIEFAYDYGNLNASYVNEKINFSDDYFHEIINPDFEKIDSLFQQTSSLKPYVPNVILEMIIIDLEDEVNGDQPLPRVTQVSIARTTSTEQPPLKDKSMWSDQEKRVQKIDRLARSLLIQGLPNDIYSLIDSNKTAKDLCDALTRHMLNSEYGEQDRKVEVLYEYETFKATEGELNIMDINIDALYNILKQNQGDVNDAMGSKKKTVVVTSDPLALIAEKTNVSKSKEKVVVSLDSEGSEVDDFRELKKTTALLAKAFNRRKFYSKPTNNNLRTLSSYQSANKKQEFVKTDTKKVEMKDEEKKRDMSKVKCYNCKKEGYFAKDCKKAKVKDYEYYKTKMLLAKKDKDEQVQAWMESSSDSDQEINANMVFMAQIEKVLSDSEASSSSADKKISETDKSNVDHNDSEEKDQLVDKLIRKFNQKIVKCQNRKYAKLEAEIYEYMIRYFAYNDNDKQHRKQITDQEVLYDKMSVQLAELDKHVRDLKNTVLEKDFKISELEEYVIGLGYTPMFLTHSDEALEIEKFKRSRENKIEFAYDYGNLNASYVNEKINFEDDYFQDIVNPDFEMIDSPFQQISSLKPYVINVILEKIIIDLEDEVLKRHVAISKRSVWAGECGFLLIFRIDGNLEITNPHAHVRYFNKITSTFKFPNVLNTSIKLMLFPYSLEGAAQIWLEKEPPRLIFTWDDLVSKFINQFFHPSKTTNLRNEITNFQQRFNESFNEACDRFKDLLRACSHHGFSELHKLDTFYNALNSKDQDSLNSAVGGNFLDKMPRECLAIIESKSKVRYSCNKLVVAKVSTDTSTSSISPDVAELKDMVKALLLDKKSQNQSPAPVKAVEESCGNNFNQGPVYQPLVFQPPSYQAPAYQDLAPQTQGWSPTGQMKNSPLKHLVFEEPDLDKQELGKMEVGKPRVDKQIESNGFFANMKDNFNFKHINKSSFGIKERFSKN
nr:reverse transcriptase domain-containing protein [Tanacetum cinerariifolium]